MKKIRQTGETALVTILCVLGIIALLVYLLKVL